MQDLMELIYGFGECSELRRVRTRFKPRPNYGIRIADPFFFFVGFDFGLFLICDYKI